MVVDAINAMFYSSKQQVWKIGNYEPDKDLGWDHLQNEYDTKINLSQSNGVPYDSYRNGVLIDENNPPVIPRFLYDIEIGNYRNEDPSTI